MAEPVAVRMVPAAGERLLIAQITDTHLEETPGGRLAGMDTDASLAMVLTMFRASGRHPDLILATGDLASYGSEAAYRRVRTALDGLGVPWVWIPGNHDDPALMTAVLSDGQPMSRCVRLGDWQILLLDSTEPDQVGGTLGGQELQLLDQMLQAAGHHTVVCMHHQPVPVGSAWIDEQQIADADQLFALIDRHPSVRALLWGHVHQDFRDRYGAVQLIGSPSTCIQFRPHSEGFALDDVAPGVRWLWLEPDGTITTEVQRVADFALEYDQDSSGYL